MDAKLRQFPEAKPPDDVPCSTVLVVWLSHNLYRSWGRGWRDVIGLPAHVQQLNFFLWAVERAREASVPMWLETVLDQTVSRAVPAGYRLWLPLNDGDTNAFVAACGTSLPAVPAKRWKGSPIGSGNIASLSQAAAAVRVHSAWPGYLEVGPVMPGRVPRDHLLAQLSAERHFTMLPAAVGGTQAVLASYLRNGCLLAPSDSAKLVHALDARILCEPDALLLYTLPLDADAVSAAAMTDMCTNATGHALPSVTDATLFGDIELETLRDESTALERLLAEVYPTISRVHATWVGRFAAGADPAAFLEDIEVLFSVPAAGVPRVFPDTLAEMRQRLAALRAPDPPAAERFASRMFFRAPNPELTNLGNVLASVCSGLWVSCKLKPTQRKLFFGLFSRASGRVMANRPAGGGLYIATGPAETGKSVAMQLFLACMPHSLQCVSDGRSERAFTAKNGGPTDPDLKVEVWDELTSLLGESAAIKSQQTQLSNGCIRTERLVKDQDTGSYALESTATARRTLTVAGTNSLNSVSLPIQSRAVIVSVPALAPRVGEHTMATYAAMSQHSVAADLKAGFVFFCQTVASLQSRYWALEAAGGIPRVRDQLLLVYKLISNSIPGTPEVSARKMGEIRNMAESLMVTDLTTHWYRGGLGAEHGFSPEEELKYYRSHSVLKMEYIVSAVHTILATTSITMELAVVQDTLRQLIHLDPHHKPELSPCGNYYVLATSRQKLADDVARANPTLGPGLSKNILSKIMQSHTQGQANVRFEPHSSQAREVVLLHRRYIAQTNGAIEKSLLVYLAENLDTALPSWCEEYYVFKAAVRQTLTRPFEEDAVPSSLQDIARPHHALALCLLQDRVTVDGEPAFFLPQNHVAAGRCELDRPGACPMLKTPDTGKVRRTVLQPVVVHRSVFEAQHGPQALTSSLARLFHTCLSVAGGYDNKTIVLGINEDGPNVTESINHRAKPVSVTVSNPMYLNRDLLGDLLGSDTISQDPLFPDTLKQLVWTEASDLEAKLLVV